MGCEGLAVDEVDEICAMTAQCTPAPASQVTPSYAAEMPFGDATNDRIEIDE